NRKVDSMTSLKGVIPILSAPFTADGSYIDIEGLKRIIRTAIDEGVHGLGLFGIGTEFYKLGSQEKEEMLEATVKECAGKIPVIVSVTSHATNLAVQEAIKVQEAGADVINIFPPHFMSPSPEDVIHHFKSIANNVDLPIIIQYAPEVTGEGISVDAFLEIQKGREQPVYVKAESVPSGPLITKLREE